MQLLELTPSMWAALTQEAELELARQEFSEFIPQVSPWYHMEPFHLSLSFRLQRFYQDIVDGKSPRLMIFTPPQHGKSELGSRHFPSWVLGREPDWSIIATSYSADLATKMNRDTQRIIDSRRYAQIFPGTCLSNNKRTVQGAWVRNTEEFEIVGRRGSYRGAGVGGGITGMGGDLLIIDDPIKDRAAADSPNIRKSIIDWYTSTLRTRIRHGGGILLIMTRWHEGDLAGQLLRIMEEDSKADQWDVFRYQAIASEEEAFRSAGEALCPCRFDLDDLLTVKATLPRRDWEALYQQNPRPEDGAIFLEEWLRFYRKADLPQEFDKLCQSWDMSYSDSKGSDFVSGGVWGRLGADSYLLDHVYGRFDLVNTIKHVQLLSAKWPHVRPKCVENKANGPKVIEQLRREIPGLIPVDPKASKISRAHAVTPLVEAGNIWLPHPTEAPWVRDYIAELCAFPFAEHDDRVDMTTQALEYLYPAKKQVVFTKEMIEELKR